MERDERPHLKTCGDAASALRKCSTCDTIFSDIAYCPNDGTKLQEYQTESADNQLFAEKYLVLEEIGRGGMGTVYLVKQILLDKTFALKVIPPHSLSEQMAARFQREAKTMAALDHPNLARIIDFGTWLNQPFMVMEFLDGAPLSRKISERQIAPEQAINLFSQVLRGLQHAHDKGVLHRDIKPSNIIVCKNAEQSRAVLVDFGIAKKIDNDPMLAARGLTRTGEMIGSPLYMSPEQARGETLSEQSDLYSLGCSLFESLTGTPPFVGKTAVETLFLHLDQTAPSLKEAALGREFSPGLEGLMRKALAKNPADRFASADEMRMALSMCLQQSETVFAQKNDSLKKVFPSAPALLLGSLAVLAVAGSLFYLTQNSEKTDSKPHKSAMCDSIIASLPAENLEEILEEDGLQTARPKRYNRIQRGTDPNLEFFDQEITAPIESLITNNRALKQLALSRCTFDKVLLTKLAPSLEYLEINNAGLLGNDYEAVAKNTNVKTLLLRLNTVTGKDLRTLFNLSLLPDRALKNEHATQRPYRQRFPKHRMGRPSLG